MRSDTLAGVTTLISVLLVAKAGIGDSGRNFDRIRAETMNIEEVMQYRNSLDASGRESCDSVEIATARPDRCKAYLEANKYLMERLELESRPPLRSYAPKQSSNQQANFQIAVRWEGVSELALGRLTSSGNGDTGTLRLILTGKVGECKGSWSYGSAQGAWSLACESGLTASGTYRRETENQGRGQGLDSQGRAVEFVYGP